MTVMHLFTVFRLASHGPERLVLPLGRVEQFNDFLQPRDKLLGQVQGQIRLADHTKHGVVRGGVREVGFQLAIVGRVLKGQSISRNIPAGCQKERNEEREKSARQQSQSLAHMVFAAQRIGTHH